MNAATSWSHRHSCVLQATPAQVFAALTTAGQLRQWFAEHAHVEARADGAFSFWGRYTYGTPAAADPGQRVAHIEPDKALSFHWPFEGVGSTVRLSLRAADAQGTTLDLEHSFAQKPRVAGFEELVDDLWRLTLGNLHAHLRGGDGIVLPDYSDPSPEIRLSITIDAPRERVFRALTDPARLNGWIASSATVEPRVGGRYSYGWKNSCGGQDVEGGPTRIIDIVPDERLVTDWPDWRGDPAKPKTRVAWLLEQLAPARTRVTLVHGEFPRTVDISDYPFGWRHFLDQLKNYTEGSSS